MKSSAKMIAVSLVLLILVASSSMMTVYLQKNIKNDIEVVNQAGVIRGSMQRAVKLELSGEPNDEIIKDVDSIIADFYVNKIQFKGNKEDFLKILGNLSKDWTSLKELIYSYRQDPSSQNGTALMEGSERIWKKSCDMVLSAQLVSQSKVKYFSILYLMLLVNLLLILLIIALTKGYVQNKLEDAVSHDALTKIFNRRFFDEQLISQIKKTQRYEQDLSLIIFDIDNFKSVNDIWGHNMGDFVLLEMCKIIKKNIRRSDIFARIGGEEFAIIAPGTDIQNANILAEKVRELVENHDFKPAGRITISLGAVQHKKGDTPETIYKRADKALYTAKNNGRNMTWVSVT